jgi:hypothetical protein
MLASSDIKMLLLRMSGLTIPLQHLRVVYHIVVVLMSYLFYFKTFICQLLLSTEVNLKVAFGLIQSLVCGTPVGCCNDSKQNKLVRSVEQTSLECGYVYMRVC